MALPSKPVVVPRAAVRVRVAGKRFEAGGVRWQIKGLTYGPFSPDSDGMNVPNRVRVAQDLRHIARMGANAIRVYHVPPVWLLDDAAESGLRVLIDVPWDKHRCFMEDWPTRREALAELRQTALSVGSHPAVFAISVANEIPRDVVRFCGPGKVGRFVDELADQVRQAAPECLTTYANYPSTEFLHYTGVDFHCVNVYLEDDQALGRYLDRLHHIAGPLPLVLGEHGICSIRHGPERQAEVVTSQVRRVKNQGLAGSFVFSYTDDWFAGGQQMDDWGFGMTTRDRSEKPVVTSLRQAWDDCTQTDISPLPSVTVVVCSYNGAATLQECLQSLQELNYPNYEVILVDDGSTDRTPEIAQRFPRVRTIRQKNLGLSAARNVGARAATGEIVAYTDSDCIADADWLMDLARAMREQNVDAIGGPNVPPGSDNWVARCVAASPGGPSHVMLDDRRAEHIPGCNMAFRREQLLALGGFDEQFRTAGDDVDICWRYLDAGLTIGYAAAALVWHHRRARIIDFYRQQRGYGRAEAMLQAKHPKRHNALGASRWAGVIYGQGAVGLSTCPPAVYYGRFGTASFQTIYHQNSYSLWAYFTLFEWHAAALILMLAALALTPVPEWHTAAVGAALMELLSVTAALRSAVRAPLAKGRPWWCRPLVFLLCLGQPFTRGWHRIWYRLRHKRVPHAVTPEPEKRFVAPAGFGQFDLFWSSDREAGRDLLLDALMKRAAKAGWHGEWGGEWRPFDAELFGSRLHDLWVVTATEDLGGRKRFTRVRCGMRPTSLNLIVLAASLVSGSVIAATYGLLPGLIALGFGMGGLLAAKVLSRRRCRAALAGLVWAAGQDAGLSPVDATQFQRAPTTKASDAVQASTMLPDCGVTP